MLKTSCTVASGLRAGRLRMRRSPSTCRRFSSPSEVEETSRRARYAHLSEQYCGHYIPTRVRCTSFRGRSRSVRRDPRIPRGPTRALAINRSRGRRSALMETKTIAWDRAKNRIPAATFARHVHHEMSEISRGDVDRISRLLPFHYLHERIPNLEAISPDVRCVDSCKRSAQNFGARTLRRS
ncbi:hypothetical protein LMG24235_03259 [Paraburkholderia sabiae]|nr:hypothetical protein LMG24235_03259 [Paraburkholderia sabiae]